MAPTEQDPTGGKVTLVPTGEHAFRSLSEGPFVEDGDPVRFELGPDGRAARMKWGENYKDRVDWAPASS